MRDRGLFREELLSRGVVTVKGGEEMSPLGVRGRERREGDLTPTEGDVTP